MSKPMKWIGLLIQVLVGPAQGTAPRAPRRSRRPRTAPRRTGPHPGEPNAPGEPNRARYTEAPRAKPNRAQATRARARDSD
jgi:hypothetical protein